MERMQYTYNGRSVDKAMSEQSLRKRAALISVAVGLLMLTMKTGGYLVTNSAAILSDALESVVHVIATCIAFYSVVLAARPADKSLPYGYGKIEYFSAGLEGALIIVAAIAICHEAVVDIIAGHQLHAINTGVWLMATAGGINLFLGLYLVRVGKATNSLILIADGKHVLTDSYTSLGVLFGLLLVKLTGMTFLDPLVAIAVAGNILFTGYRLIRQSVRGLMNVTDEETVKQVEKALKRGQTKDIVDIHDIRTWSAGAQKFVDFHMTLPFYYSLGEIERIQERMRREVIREFKGGAEVMVHLDPCNYSMCGRCANTDCQLAPQDGENMQGSERNYVFSDIEFLRALHREEVIN